MGGLAARVEKAKKRANLEAKFFEERMNLKEGIRQASIAGDSKLAFELSQKLDRISRDSSSVRQRRRCKFTGRSRSVYSKINASRLVLRESAAYGILPGLRKT